jgi:hypothetical protein
MPNQTIPIQLPDAIYQRLHQVAHTTNHSIEEVVLQTIRGNLPPSLDDLSPEWHGVAKLVTTSFTPVRNEADRTGPPGAHAGTLTGRRLARSPWMARDPAWGNVGTCSAPAGHHHLMLMLRRA